MVQKYDMWHNKNLPYGIFMSFTLLHPLVEVDFLPFIEDFHLEMEDTLDRETFISALVHSPCLSSDDPLGMVYELLQDCFVLDDYVNDFDLFFKVCGHIAQGHVPP
jgi:hypothetical protein